jgi:hypothetical protein
VRREHVSVAPLTIGMFQISLLGRCVFVAVELLLVVPGVSECVRE